MAVATIPDAERIVSDYLRSHADVVALATRVVGKTPDTVSTSWVRVTLLDAANEAGSRPERLIDYMLQLDCFAGATGGQPEANSLARTVRAVLHEMPGLQGGVVVTCVRFIGMARIPDTDFEPARERIVLTATVWMHG